jgi:hypothetical protein
MLHACYDNGVRALLCALLLACSPAESNDAEDASLDSDHLGSEVASDAVCSETSLPCCAGASLCVRRSCSCGLTYTLCASCRGGTWDWPIDDNCHFGCRDDDASVTETTSPPSFAPPAGAYAWATAVRIESTTAGAIIYYTTDGTSPNTSSPKYSSPIILTKDVTLSAMAKSPGFIESKSIIATYTVTSKTTVDVVSFAPPGGTYVAPQTLVLTSATKDTTICYTLNGGVPTCDETAWCLSSTKYVAPIDLKAGTTVVRAIACKADWIGSPLTTATFVVTAP